MSAPPYRWMCHRCERVNEPGLKTCTSCGFPAVASAVDIARERGEPDPSRFTRETPSGSWWWLVPELPIAGVVVCAAPLWAIVLFIQRHYVQGAILLVGAAAGGYGLFWAIKANEKWPAYIIVIAILGLAVFASN
jgi:hypothetical protein